METKITSVLLLMVTITIFCSCGSKTTQNKGITNPNDTLISLKNDLFYKFSFSGDTLYSITWGNKNNSNKSEFIEVLGNGTLKLLDYSESCILLGQSCGTSCSSYVFLPIKPNSKARKYLFGKAYNLKTNTVAYIPELESFLTVENFLTNAKMDIKESDLCPASFKGDCIDSCFIKNDSLYIFWQGSKWESNKLDPKKRFYKIDLK